MFELEDAIELAVQEHKGQRDKVGECYILHPLRVMFSFETYQYKERMTAILHDILEDTSITAEDLLRMDCDPEAVQAVVALTYSKAMKASGTTYLNFIRIAAKNPIARSVKIHDIKDNSSMERLLRLDPATQDRLMKKYSAALNILETIQ